MNPVSPPLRWLSFTAFWNPDYQGMPKGGFVFQPGRMGGLGVE